MFLFYFCYSGVVDTGGIWCFYFISVILGLLIMVESDVFIWFLLFWGCWYWWNLMFLFYFCYSGVVDTGGIWCFYFISVILGLLIRETGQSWWFIIYLCYFGDVDRSKRNRGNLIFLNLFLFSGDVDRSRRNRGNLIFLNLFLFSGDVDRSRRNRGIWFFLIYFCFLGMLIDLGGTGEIWFFKIYFCFLGMLIDLGGTGEIWFF